MIDRPTRRRERAASFALRVCLVCIALAFVALAASNPGFAQAAPAQDAAPQTNLPSAAELEALAATISDDAKRKELLSALQGLIEQRKAAEAEAPPSLSDRLVATAEASAATGKKMIDEIMTEMGDMPGVIDSFQSLAGDPQTRERLLLQVGILAVIVAAAWIAEFIIWKLLAGTRARLRTPRGAGPSRRAPRVLTLAALGLLPPLAFLGGGYAGLVFIDHDPQIGALALRFLFAYAAARVLLTLAGIAFAPESPQIRLVPASDETAGYLYIWTRRFVNLGIFGYFLIAALPLLGMPQSSFDVLVRILGFLLVALLVVFILQNRSPVGALIRGRDPQASPSPARRFFASTWHVFAIAYAIGVFLVWAWDVWDVEAYLFRVTLGSALIMAVGLLIAFGLRRMLERSLGISEEEYRRYPRLRARANRYLPVTITTIRSIVLVLTILAILEVWGVDIFGWILQPLGSRIVGGVISVIIVLAIAVLVWEIANIAIERRLEKVEDESADPGRAARLRTLLPLMRKALFAVLTVMVALIVLAELGVNIGPLLAGAGIFGLAIGFGAQTLVKDIITGAFLLIEDALAVGDVVTVTGIGGLVEDMSIRSIRLRDLSGNVHTIPFSSVDTVTNMTKDFSYYLLDIAVAYREDTDEVARVCCEIVEEMRSEVEFAPLILEPLEVLGVDQFADSAVILKARIKTKPIKQWFVGREFNRRLKKRFDALGIEIPFPHRTLYFGVHKDGTAPPAHVQFDGKATVASASPPSTSPATGAAEGRADDRRVQHVAADLPDPHPEAGPGGGPHDGDDGGSESR